MKMRFFAFAAVLGALVISSGCVVHEERVREHCAGGEWIPGHRGPHGAWHEGHWRCPRVHEVVEID